MARQKKTDDATIVDIVNTVEGAVITNSAAEDADAYAKTHEGLQPLYVLVDTPYLLTPNLNTNVAGMIPKGSVCYIRETIDNGDKGKFWQVSSTARKQYINQDWQGVQLG